MPSNAVKFTPEKPVKERKGHSKTVTIFSSIILVVIVVTFIGAPVVSQIAGERSYVFGYYDGIPIQFVQGNYFARQVEAINRYYEQFNQGGNNTDVIRQLVWRQAFQQMALHVALQREAQLAGIVVTDGQVDKQLVNYPAYQKDGVFNEEVYRNTPAAEQFRYKQETQSEMLLQQYANDHALGTFVSDSEKTFISKMNYPQRKFSFVTFTDSDYPDVQVSDYAAKNKNLFRTINLSRITVDSSEADASKIRDEAAQNLKTFEDLAKNYSKDALAETGGALNPRFYYEIKSEFEKPEDLDKIFGMKKGEISPVIKKGNSWAIYKISAASSDADLTKPETLSTVRSYISKNDRGLLEDYLENKAKDFTKGLDAKNFSEMAKKLGKTPETTGFIALNFGNLDFFGKFSDASKNTVFQGLSADEDFFKKTFKLGKDAISEPVLASPSVLVIKVDDVKEAPLAGDKPFETSAIDSLFERERNQALQKQVLESPKFKDDFATEFAKVFPTK